MEYQNFAQHCFPFNFALKKKNVGCRTKYINCIKKFNAYRCKVALLSA